jgi:hypothetical protein
MVQYTTGRLKTSLPFGKEKIKRTKNNLKVLVLPEPLTLGECRGQDGATK